MVRETSKNAMIAYFPDLPNEQPHIQDLHMTYSSDNMFHNHAMCMQIDGSDAETGQLENVHRQKSRISVFLSWQVTLMMCIAIPVINIQSVLLWVGLLAA